MSFSQLFSKVYQTRLSGKRILLLESIEAGVLKHFETFDSEFAISLICTEGSMIKEIENSIKNLGFLITTETLVKLDFENKQVKTAIVTFRVNKPKPLLQLTE